MPRPNVRGDAIDRVQCIAQVAFVSTTPNMVLVSAEGKTVAQSSLSISRAFRCIKGVWHASERVLVGFDHRPHTRRVIRDAWRLAHGLHADLIAVSIQPEGYSALMGKLIGWIKYGGEAKRQREEALRRLEEHAVLAEDLGAEVISMSSHDIAQKLVEIARERQVTQLVLGQPARSPWEEFIRGSIVNRLLRLSTDIDIHLVPRSHEEEK